MKTKNWIISSELTRLLDIKRRTKSKFGKEQLVAYFLIAAIIHLVSGVTFVNSQYLQVPCDSTKLLRCQQDVLRDMQTMSLNSVSVQHPISGPPYSPREQASLLINPYTCRSVRSNLDCLLTATPACYDQGSQIAQNTDLILRAKRFIEQNGCNSPDVTWQSSSCFRSDEVRNCEGRYGFTSFSISSMTNNVSACHAYQAFKYCIESHLRSPQCGVRDLDMANEYLIDRATDLSWRCPANISGSILAQNPYSLNQPSALLSPSSYSNYANYEQRPIPTYVGSQSGSYSYSRDQPWERFRNPIDNFGISRYPHTGDVFERLVAGSPFGADTSDCPEKAAPYARECEDTLEDQQRQARDSRDGNELQRRICCSLLQYRDCISRVVLDRCADSSPTAVEILMGIRRREMTVTCRLFNREICNGSKATAVLNIPIMFTILILTSFMAFKHSL